MLFCKNYSKKNHIIFLYVCILLRHVLESVDHLSVRFVSTAYKNVLLYYTITITSLSIFFHIHKAAHSSETQAPLVSQPQAAYPAQPQAAYPAQPQAAYPKQPEGAYPTQPEGAYPVQPNHPPPYTLNETQNMTTTTIVGQPTTIWAPLTFGPVPLAMVCPHCNAQIMTTVSRDTGLLPWLVCCGLCVAG